MGMTGNAVTVIRQARFLALKGHDTNAQRSTPAVGAREFWDTRSQVGTLLHGMLSGKSERCTVVKASQKMGKVGSRNLTLALKYCSTTNSLTSQTLRLGPLFFRLLRRCRFCLNGGSTASRLAAIHHIASQVRRLTRALAKPHAAPQRTAQDCDDQCE